ncbi:MAG: glycosyltransferase family 4 protein [Gammaproteobacteria bacterium]|nr:glycosyltransferase family 4 protein [Gammaproteobacteria bacterium]
MTHVVHLETGRHLYGGGRQVLMLSKGLTERGVQSTLVCPPDSDIATSADPFVNVHALNMGGDLDAGFAFRFSEFLRDIEPDLVHVHSRRGADMWGGLGARWAKVPAVLTRRVDNPEPALLAPMKYGRYQRVIGVSNGILNVLRQMGVAEDKLRLVYSAVDAENCQPVWTHDQFKEAFELHDNSQTVACVAQFIPRKGHNVLFEAWADVNAACPDARLLLFGRGPDRERLQAQVGDSVYGASVHFAGFRADIRDFIGLTDVLVHPARQEGLGVVLLEAQAAGVPVIASRAGGMPEAIADGVSGELVEPGNAGELAKRLIRLLRDAELREAMGAAGRVRVADYFSPQAMVSGNLAIYREIVDGLPR